MPDIGRSASGAYTAPIRLALGPVLQGTRAALRHPLAYGWRPKRLAKSPGAIGRPIRAAGGEAV